MPAEIFANNAQGKLVGAIDAVTTTVVVAANSAGYPFPSTGNFRILIDSEIILVENVAVAGTTYTFTNCVRGVEVGTTPAAVAASHADGVLVVQPYTAASIPQAIEDRIVQIAAGGVTASSGTVVLSNSNNVSFGLAGSVVTASAEALVNVSGGTTSSNVSAFTFSNAHNVSFGFDGTNITATAGAAAGSVNFSAGTTSNNLTAITFSNSNGVSFGLNGSTITASIAPPSAANINLSAGTTSNLSSAFTFANANGVSFGLNAGTLTASIAPVASSLTAINVSAGTTSNNLSALTFSNSNGLSFGLNGSTITASVGGLVGTVTAFSQDADFVTNFPAMQAGLSFQKVSLPMNLLATQLAMLVALGGSSASSGALTISHAVYTFNGSTASLASSASRVISFTSGGNTGVSSQYGGASGTRYRTMGVSYSMPPGDYLFAWWISTANGVNASVFGRAGLNIVGGFDGVETSYFLNGSSVSSVVAFPPSVAATNTNYARTGFSAMLQPGVILIGTGG